MAHEAHTLRWLPEQAARAVVLGRKAGVVGHRSAHLPFSSSSAA